MASAPVLTVGLQTIRAEFDTVFPRRSKTSDGWIGDLAHQNEAASGHNPDITGAAEYRDDDALNEVRAIDVTKDLNDASSRAVTMERVVQYLVGRGRAGIWLPLAYIIYNRRIWAASWGWTEREYTGPNPHDKHAHLSGGYSQAADNWRGSLGLATLTGGTVLDQTDKDWMLANLQSAVVAKVASKIGDDMQVPASGIYKGLVRRAAEGTAAGFASIVEAISALDAVDEVALADALAPAIAQQVAVLLPEGVEGLTSEQITGAVKAALRQGTGGEAA